MTGEHGLTPAGLDLKTLGVVILRNGDVAATPAGAAVLGSPLNSVALLANMLGKRDREIPAGTLVLTGGITESVPINPVDHFTFNFQHLGSIDLHVTNWESGFDAYCLDKDDHWPERSAESGAHPYRREICQHRVGCTGGNGTYHDKRICERKLGNWSGFGEIERALTEVEHFSVISQENQERKSTRLNSSH